MKNEGGWEACKRLKVLPDRGDRCLFIFLWSSSLFCNVFPFPVAKAQLIGNWYENRRGAPNTSSFLIFRHSYWRTDVLCANRGGGPNRKKKLLEHCVWSALPIGAPMSLATSINVIILNMNAGGSLKKRRTEPFGALHLFSWQSPINWALQTGNGNTSKKRRRQH